MKIQPLFQSLQYVGRAEGDRRSYYVFAGREAYLVVAQNSRGGLNVNIVDRKLPDLISGRFRGRNITSKKLGARGRSGHFRDPFARLNALYVMVALGRARKLKIREGRSMVFQIK